MYKGTLKKVFIERGFGFIGVAGTEKTQDVFVHFSKLVDADVHDMLPKTEVSFDIAIDSSCGKSQAVNVRLLSQVRAAKGHVTPAMKIAPQRQTRVASVLIKTFETPTSIFDWSRKEFNGVRRWMELIASEAGGQLEMTQTSLRFYVPGRWPDLEKTIAVKNLRGLVHGRYSLAKHCPASAEIDPTTLRGLPHEVKAELAQLKKQQRKTEGKLGRKRTNYQKSVAGRAAFL